MRALRVVPIATVPIMINRSTPRCGYWDDPVDRVRPSEVQLEFVRFFDWDVLGRRDFRHVEVRIRGFAEHPELVDRHALVEFEYVRILTA